MCEAWNDWVAQGKPSGRRPQWAKKLGKKLLIPLLAWDAYDGYTRDGVNGAAENLSGVTDAKDCMSACHNALEGKGRDKLNSVVDHNTQTEQVLNNM